MWAAHALQGCIAESSPVSAAQRCYLDPLLVFFNREGLWCTRPPLPLKHSVTLPLPTPPLSRGEDLTPQDGITDVIELAPFAMHGVI